MNYNTQLQTNNTSLQEILDRVNSISISNIYIVETDTEPDNSIGEDGDLYLVVNAG